MLFDRGLGHLGPELLDVRRDRHRLGSISSSPSPRSSDQSKNCFTACAYARRVLRLRMLAVKNSMNRRLARSPRERMEEGRAPIPARASAAGSGSSSVKRIGSLPDILTFGYSARLWKH